MNQPRSISVRFVCCLCFARAFSFQDHTKIAICYFFFSCFVFLFVFFNGRHILFPLINTWNYAIENVFPASIA